MRRLTSIQLYKKFTIDFALDDFKQFSKLIEQQFTNTLQNYENEASKLPEDEREAYYDYYYDEWSPYKNDYPKIHRNSLLISIYSFLESTLINLCKRSMGKYHLSLSHKDINGKGIEQAQKYLIKVAKIEFPNNSNEWQFIKFCNEVRNCLVHNQGFSYDDNKKSEKLEKLINETPYIKVDGTGEIILEENFCPLFIEKLEGFFEKLYLSVEKKDEQMIL